MHAVGVHDPRHQLIIGVDVGRGHILFWTDRIDDLCDIPPRQRLKLASRHPRRIAHDPSLAAAEWDVRDGALPRHPRRERGHLVERHAGLIANAALSRPERNVVLDGVPGEHFDLVVVHLDGARDDDLALGVRQDLPNGGFEIQDAGCSVKLVEHGTGGRSVCGHDAPNPDGEPRVRCPSKSNRRYNQPV